MPVVSKNMLVRPFAAILTKLHPFRFKFLRLVMPLNILDMFVTFEVSQLLKSKSVRLDMPLNILDMLVTDEMSQLEKAFVSKIS